MNIQSFLILTLLFFILQANGYSLWDIGEFSKDQTRFDVFRHDLTFSLKNFHINVVMDEKRRIEKKRLEKKRLKEKNLEEKRQKIIKHYLAQTSSRFLEDIHSRYF